MKKIPITRFKKVIAYAIVDDEDFEELSKYKWLLGNGYAITQIRRSRNWVDGYETIYMHRLITKCPKNLQVDHINHNKLDNCRKNLRNCTASENRKNSAGNLSRECDYKGVSRVGEWYLSIIKHKNVTINLGKFKTQKEAAIKYNEAAKKYHGEFAFLNII